MDESTAATETGSKNLRSTSTFLHAGRPGARELKKSEVVARDIVRRIAAARLSAGAVLPNEPEMIAEFGVGRTTLREALRLLESRGVLRIRPGRYGGPVVRNPTAADLGDVLTLMLHFDGATLSDIFEARRTIEPLIVREAAQGGDIELIRQMEETVEATRHDPSDETARSEAIRFHILTASACRNPVMRLFQDALRTMCDAAFEGAGYSSALRERDAVAHERIIAAIRARDCDEAEDLARAHMDEAASFWTRRYPVLFARSLSW